MHGNFIGIESLLTGTPGIESGALKGDSGSGLFKVDLDVLQIDKDLSNEDIYDELLKLDQDDLEHALQIVGVSSSSSAYKKNNNGDNYNEYASTLPGSKYNFDFVRSFFPTSHFDMSSKRLYFGQHMNPSDLLISADDSSWLQFGNGTILMKYSNTCMHGKINNKTTNKTDPRNSHDESNICPVRENLNFPNFPDGGVGYYESYEQFQSYGKLEFVLEDGNYVLKLTSNEPNNTREQILYRKVVPNQSILGGPVYIEIISHGYIILKVGDKLLDIIFSPVEGWLGF